METIFVGIHARLVSHCVTFMLLMEMVDVQVEDHNWFAVRRFECVAFMHIMEMLEVAVLVEDDNWFAGSCFQSQTGRQVVCLATKWGSEAHPWKDRAGLL